MAAFLHAKVEIEGAFRGIRLHAVGDIVFKHFHAGWWRVSS